MGRSRNDRLLCWLLWGSALSISLLSFAVDDQHNNVSVSGVFRATHSDEGGPVPATNKRVEADYTYIMDFDGDRISAMRKIWNDGHSMQQIGWA